jgi:nucleotide-binding universal stress UspA family protein
MATLRRVACATDFSPASDPAWDFAQRLALATGADLVLVHAIPPILFPLEDGIDPATYQQMIEEGRREARAAGAEAARRAGERGLHVAVHIDEGPVVGRILGRAEAENADVLVLGTHGRAGLARFLMGSVAERLVEEATRPVVTVRPVRGQAPASRPITRIAFATDFSEAAARAWPWARAVAEATGATLDLLHVLLEAVPDRHADPAFLAGVAAAIREDARTSADRFLAGCGFPRERVEVHFLHGVEADQIVRWAEARHVDLVVLGTHGRTGLLRLAFGSVARRVLHAAPCPVLTVGPRVVAVG